MGEMKVQEVRELLEVLHDRLAYVLSDPSGEIFHGEEYRSTFESAIESLRWR